MKKELTPKQIVEALDRHVVGQKDAKKSVAIALRNRWRRRQIKQPLRDEVMPANILMIGSTGVGKTEIARRLAQLVNAPFIKVEATKFTEVGYVGRDVESIIRELTEQAISDERRRQEELVREKASIKTRERLIDQLSRKNIFPSGSADSSSENTANTKLEKEKEELEEKEKEDSHFHEQKELFDGEILFNPGKNFQKLLENVGISGKKTDPADRKKLEKMLVDGELEDYLVELEVPVKGGPTFEIFSSSGVEELGVNIGGMIGGMFQGRKQIKSITIKEAREVIMEEESSKLVNHDEIVRLAKESVEQEGIVFLDEMDKIVGAQGGHGPDISRHGVQRDLLPLVEGSTVITKYGPVKTDHILFIGAGAFHLVKPTDLIPELQGRFPIRVELADLEKEDFVRILREPEGSLLIQAKALLEADGVELWVDDEAIEEIARIAFDINSSVANIGARRLYTILEKLLEDISFSAPDGISGIVEINKQIVVEKLDKISKDEGSAKYIL